MKGLVWKVIFCSIFISLVSLMIFEYTKIETASGQIISEIQPIQYINESEAEDIIRNNKGVIVIDVRNNKDYIQYHLENSLNIPVREMNEHLKELEQYKDKKIILYCSNGNRSKVAAIQLEALGYKNLYVIKEGIKQK